MLTLLCPQVEPFPSWCLLPVQWLSQILCVCVLSRSKAWFCHWFSWQVCTHINISWLLYFIQYWRNLKCNKADSLLQNLSHFPFLSLSLFTELGYICTIPYSKRIFNEYFSITNNFIYVRTPEDTFFPHENGSSFQARIFVCFCCLLSNPQGLCQMPGT